jgi:hypothetical protein
MIEGHVDKSVGVLFAIITRKSPKNEVEFLTKVVQCEEPAVVAVYELRPRV